MQFSGKNVLTPETCFENERSRKKINKIHIHYSKFHVPHAALKLSVISQQKRHEERQSRCIRNLLAYMQNFSLLVSLPFSLSFNIDTIMPHGIKH